MKVFKISVFLFFLFLVSCCNLRSQEKVNEADVPVLIDNSLHTPLIIKDKNISDSLKVTFRVVVSFQSPLKDDTKEVVVNSIKIQGLKVISLKTEEEIINNRYYNTSGSPFQKYIWNLCSEKLEYWYHNQPYETMPSRVLWDKQAVFGGNLFIYPQHE